MSFDSLDGQSHPLLNCKISTLEIQFKLKIQIMNTLRLFLRQHFVS